VARSEIGARELQREREVLEALRADERLGSWRDLLPRCDSAGTARNEYVLERLLPGVDAACVQRAAPARELEIAALGLEAIRPLHLRTGRQAVVSRRQVGAWLGPPLELLAASHPTGRVPARQLHALELLETRLTGALAGAPVLLTWVHGDYTPGNVLLAGKVRAVTGIVDWCQGREDRIPDTDQVMWLAALHCQLSGRQLGAVVCDELRRSAGGTVAFTEDGTAAFGSRRSGRARVTPWTALLQLLELERAEHEHPGGYVPVADALLWAWLDHVTGNLTKSPRYLRSVMWWAANVEPVLATLREQQQPHVSAYASVAAARAGAKGATPPVVVGAIVRASDGSIGTSTQDAQSLDSEEKREKGLPCSTS
jgi:hypothetical protein